MQPLDGRELAAIAALFTWFCSGSGLIVARVAEERERDYGKAV